MGLSIIAFVYAVLVCFWFKTKIVSWRDLFCQVLQLCHSFTLGLKNGSIKPIDFQNILVGSHCYMNRHLLFRAIEIWQNWDTFCKLDSCFGLPWGSVVKNLPAMQKTWVWSLGQEDPLETGMATHSRIHAWEIPWTKESGGLQSMELQKSQTQLSV